MIFLIGSGSRRTRVGMATIWSPLTELRILEQIDDFNPVSPRQMLLAEFRKICERADRFRSPSRNIEPEIELRMAHRIFSRESRLGSAGCDPVVGNSELAQLIRMRHAAGLQYRHPSTSPAISFFGCQHDPGIHQREITVSVESRAPPAGVRLVNSAVMLSCLQEVDHSREHRAQVHLCAGDQQIRHRIQDHDIRLQVLDRAMHEDEMGLQPMARRPVSMDLERASSTRRKSTPAARMLRIIWRGVLFEQEIEAPFPPATSGIAKCAPKVVLPCRRPRDQNRAPAVISVTAEHLVELPRAAGHAIGRRVVLQGERRHRQDVVASASIRNGYSFVPWCEPRYGRRGSATSNFVRARGNRVESRHPSHTPRGRDGLASYHPLARNHHGEVPIFQPPK